MQQRLYHSAIAVGCRTCHIAQDGILSFSTYDSVVNSPLSSLIAADVCGTHRMPDAEQTTRVFWDGPARGYLLGAFGLQNEVCK